MRENSFKGTVAQQFFRPFLPAWIGQVWNRNWFLYTQPCFSKMDSLSLKKLRETSHKFVNPSSSVERIQNKKWKWTSTVKSEESLKNLNTCIDFFPWRLEKTKKIWRGSPFNVWSNQNPPKAAIHIWRTNTQKSRDTAPLMCRPIKIAALHTWRTARYKFVNPSLSDKISPRNFDVKCSKMLSC